MRTYRQLNTAIWEFYAVFFGYRDVGELFDLLFEGATPRLLHGVPISLRGQRGLVSLDGLFRHYDRCAEFFETHEVRDDALAFVRAANTRALHA